MQESKIVYEYLQCKKAKLFMNIYNVRTNINIVYEYLQ